jgi:hypothetical protein
MSQRTVWVHRIPVAAMMFDQTVAMPEGSRLVHCREQYDNIAFWFDVPDQLASRTEERRFQIYGTGHTIPDDLVYQGTCIFAVGDLVLHVYEVSS